MLQVEVIIKSENLSAERDFKDHLIQKELPSTSASAALGWQTPWAGKQELLPLYRQARQWQ